MTSISTRYLLGLLVFFASLAHAGPDKLIDQFIQNHENLKFDEQVELIEENKASIAAAIDQLIVEAMKDDKRFEQRMYLLDIASSMAYMHAYWNKDKAPKKKVDAIIKIELAAEEKRVASIMKWKKEERFLGNFVMKSRADELNAANLSPVLYPHWLHRIMYECKVCHDSIFKMKRWSNDINQQAIVAGKQCGVCHDGKIAFSAKEQCERCHIAGRPEAEKHHHPEKVDQASIKKAVEGVGAEWHPDKLPEGKLPLDKWSFIDWLELKKRQAFKPLMELKGVTDHEGTRDNKILFVSKSDFVDNVLFDHKVHSDWINCSSCHPRLFKDKLAENNIKMVEMSKGRYCGQCHGKVSFTFANCKRCHNSAKGVQPEGVLERTVKH